MGWEQGVEHQRVKQHYGLEADAAHPYVCVRGCVVMVCVSRSIVAVCVCRCRCMVVVARG